MTVGGLGKRRAGDPSAQIRDTSTAIAVDGVTKRFGAADANAVVALDDVSITVPDGQLVALLGPSGCGRSTPSASSPAC